jgi:hypothetical protein
MEKIRIRGWETFGSATQRTTEQCYEIRANFLHRSGSANYCATKVVKNEFVLMKKGLIVCLRKVDD